jgi:hypothetical protein
VYNQLRPGCLGDQGAFKTRSNPDPVEVVKIVVWNGRDGFGELEMIAITVSRLPAGLNRSTIGFENKIKNK